MELSLAFLASVAAVAACCGLPALLLALGAALKSDKMPQQDSDSQAECCERLVRRLVLRRPSEPDKHR